MSKLIAEETNDSNKTEELVEKTYKTEAAKKIASAQTGVPKKSVTVKDHAGAEFKTLCDALVAHGLDKVKDWPAARNALKRTGTYIATVETTEGEAYDLTLTTVEPIAQPVQEEQAA